MNPSAADRAAEFVRRFETYWQAPDIQGLVELLAADVHLEAPSMPTTDTLAAGQEVWGGLLALVPDLKASVHRWGATHDGVLIEFTLSGTLPGGPFSWGVVDRFVLGEDGLATERIGYFDSAPVVAALSATPLSTG